MWTIVFLIALVLESLLLIVLLRAGAIDQAKASQAVEASMAKLIGLFKPKPK